MKSEILDMLRRSAPLYVSGEALSRAFGVSRTAIWKYIKELKEENYNIESSPRKGYRLISLPDRPNSFDIGYDLGTAVIGTEIFYFDSLDSTNKYARKLAAEGCKDGTVVAAGKQTEGRGRLGRKWESPEGKGIYVSIILKPSISPEEIHVITIAAAAAAASAIEKAAGVSVGIKWPNDIVVDGKKVCGILTEMSSEVERVNFVVCGIGINYSQKPEDFPKELRDKAVSLAMIAEQANAARGDFDRLSLIRALLVEFDKAYASIVSGNKNDIMETWKSLSVTLGREVCIYYKDRTLTGRALDITEDGRLVVEGDDGAVREIISGEVSVRGLLGYV